MGYEKILFNRSKNDKGREPFVLLDRTNEIISILQLGTHITMSILQLISLQFRLQIMHSEISRRNIRGLP